MGQIKLSLTIIAIALLSSCVSIPIPPTGEHQGKLGYIKVSISYTLKQQNETRERSSSMNYAWNQFSKTLKDK